MQPALAETKAGACDLAFVLPDLRLGGAQRVATNLIRAWAAQGRRVCVITLAGVETDFFPLDQRASRVALDLQVPSESLLAALTQTLRRIVRLRAAIRASGTRRVLAFVAGTNILTVLATRGLGLRVVISERNDPSRQNIGRAWQVLRRLTYRFASLVTANSQVAIAALREYLPERRLAFIANGVGHARPSAPEQQRESFLAVGRLTDQKGFDVLLDAFARCAAMCPTWTLVVAGDGPNRARLIEQAERLGIASAVVWLGAIANIDDAYQRAGAFVMPSRFEGMPNALLEAMSFGLPVVATDNVSAARELVSVTGAGLVVPADDAVALAQAMCELAASPSDRARMGRAGVAAVKPLSLEAALREWDSALQW